jgi:hypothetical protein
MLRRANRSWKMAKWFVVRFCTRVLASFYIGNISLPTQAASVSTRLTVFPYF